MAGFRPVLPKGWPLRSDKQGLSQSPDSPNFQPGREPSKQTVNKGLGTNKTTYKTQLGAKAPRPSQKTQTKKSLVNRPVTKANSAGVPHPAAKQTVKGLGATDPHVAANPVPKAPKATKTTTVRTTANSSAATAPAPLMTAAGMVDAQLAPILASLDTVGKGYDTQANTRADQIKSMTQQLIQQLSGAPADIGKLYDTALAQNTGLSQMSAQLLAQANPNAQVQNDLAAIGAPAGQQQQVATQLGNTFNGGAAALFGAQGVIPGQTLISDKAAKQTEAIGHLSSLAGLGEKNLMDALAQDNTFRSGLAQQRTNVEAKRPALLQQAANDILTNKQKAQALAQNQQIVDFNTGLKVKASNRADAQLGLQMRRLDLQTKQTLSNIYGRDAQGNLTLAGQRAATAALKARQTPKGKQPKASELQQMAHLAYYGTPDKTDANGNVIPGTKAVSYQTALFGLLNQGVKLVVAQRYLNEFYAPGEDGRPVKSFQQRKKK